ncbi:hypothetical protein AMTR_s00005p00244730 [Amborella trichopoda]|uniref:Uncharacterized protein n=1 Tax=Amborella trichopoda TaxID=13333 RepID=W1PGU7_AMBTC|nr:hypothetical protein AMTR_s00005p00244730 [Amborella trichopoda]
MVVRSCDLRMDDNHNPSYEELLPMDGKPPNPKTKVLPSSSLGSGGGGYGYGFQVIDGNQGNQALCGWFAIPIGGFGLKAGCVTMVSVVSCEARGEYGDVYQVVHDDNKGIDGALNMAEPSHGVVEDVATATASKLLSTLIESSLAPYKMLDGSSNSSTSGARCVGATGYFFG